MVRERTQVCTEALSTRTNAVIPLGRELPQRQHRFTLHFTTLYRIVLVYSIIEHFLHKQWWYSVVLWCKRSYNWRMLLLEGTDLICYSDRFSFSFALDFGANLFRSVLYWTVVPLLSFHATLPVGRSRILLLSSTDSAAFLFFGFYILFS